jgi:hypothetical protein
MHFKEEFEQEETGQNQKEYSQTERKHPRSSTPESSDRHSMTVIPPKRRITIPLAISSLLKFFSLKIDNC